MSFFRKLGLPELKQEAPPPGPPPERKPREQPPIVLEPNPITLNWQDPQKKKRRRRGSGQVGVVHHHTTIIDHWEWRYYPYEEFYGLLATLLIVALIVLGGIAVCAGLPRCGVPQPPPAEPAQPTRSR